MSETENNSSKNDWWRFYFVRHFVGTVIGALIILFLVNSNNPLLNSQSELATILKALNPKNYDSGYVAVLTAVGLMFSFIASAPILVLHATRGSLLKVRSWSHKPIVIFTVITICTALFQICVLWFAVRAISINSNPWTSIDFYQGSLILIAGSILSVGQYFLLGLSLFNKENDALKYYDALVNKRSIAKKSGQEYIESYRHLREHGNAFLIILLELLLAGLLYYSPVPWAVLLMFWVAPAAGVWFFGTLLESRNF